jgi:heterodisulfide reductase subunit A
VKRIGVFVCHCGLNIAGTVDVERVAEQTRQYPGVACVVDYKYVCSDPGQNLIKEAIREHNLDGVVVAACSPSMHEATFRRTCGSEGLNPYQCEIANIREQCSWVHREVQAEATSKAIEIVKTVVEKVRFNESLVPLTLPLVKRAMVIGGGVAGVQAALDIADAGYPVVLVERDTRLGGHAAQLSGTYLNIDDASEMLAPMIRRVEGHHRIQVLTEADVLEAGGYVGNFTVKVSRQEGVAIEPIGDDSVTFTFDVGAIVVATGYELYSKERLGEYGGNKYSDVIDGLQFERMLAPDGPTGGEIRRPSDGRVPKQVVFVQCAGSRDPELHKPYCSKVCCMYVAKQATMYKQRIPQGQAYVFYIDIRSQGKGYEEFVQTAMEDYGVLYLRGKVSKVFEEDGKVTVWGVDTLTGAASEVAADLVVLATATVPSADAENLAQRLRISVDEHGFFNEAHAKLRPVESLTPGIFLAGAGLFPKDIPETISQASGAAAKALQLFSQQEMVLEPIIARVNDELCSGCGLCVEACPYEALAMHSRRPVAVVNQALCQGCSACVAVCPSKACSVHNFDTAQLLAMVDTLL